jgi:hypothetical protein
MSSPSRVGVACAYQHSSLPPTMQNPHRRLHHAHNNIMAGFVPQRSLPFFLDVASSTPTSHRKYRLFMSIDDDEHDAFIEERTMTISNSNEAALASGIMASDNAEKDAIFDNLLPSTRAFTTSSASSRSKLISSKNNNGRRDNTADATRMMGPSSSALFPVSTSSSSTSKSSETTTTTSITASWKERLVNVSNIASFLCILDCTLLPLFSVVMPALSWGAGAIVGGGTSSATTGGFGGAMGASIMAYLPALSHGIALYFVIPMGIVTSLINYYYGHGEWKFSLFSSIGLILIFIANNSSVLGLLGGALGMDISHHHHHAYDACGAMIGAATSMMAHTCPVGGGGEGLVHRLTNTLGCGLLLGSNYAGKKYMENAKMKDTSISRAKGCVASAFSEAWGGGGRNGGEEMIICGCIDCGPSYGAGSALGASRREGDNFFQWKQSSGRRR